MKNKSTLKVVILLAVWLSITCTNLNAQFGITPGTVPLLNYGRTTALIQGVGIGTFPAGVPTSSRFHVNNFYCNDPGGALNGLLFRTDGSNAVNNSWSIFTGPNIPGLQQVFTLTIPAATTNVNIDASSVGDLNFLTGNTQRMTIKGTNAGGSAGNVGIGITLPVQKLVVANGNIDVNTANTGYMINNVITLWRGSTGNVDNIFVGAGAGSFSTGTNNTFCGAASGAVSTSGSNNTFIGWGSGLNNDGAGDNTFIGHRSGLSTIGVGSIQNTFVGSLSGEGNTSGTRNTFMGYQSGAGSNTGNRNTFMGWSSGSANDGASDNTFLGYRSGFANSGAGSIQNTFVGSQCGQANVTGTRNTFMGFESGFSHNTGAGNVYIGWSAGHQGGLSTGTIVNDNIMIGAEAGYNNLDANENIFIGTRAGFTQNTLTNGNVYIGHNSGLSGTTGYQNVFVGWKTGVANTIGGNNVIMGYNTGINHSTGAGNTFVGSIAAQNNTSGEVNTFIGVSAGNLNTIGNSNTFIGANATPATGNLFNTAGIGWNAVATSDNKMILGNDNVKVGIGLNNDITQFGPQNKLEIDYGLNGHDPSDPGTTGESGLRFRDLHSGNLPDVNLTNSVLSVDADGDVILVTDGGMTAVTANNGCSIDPLNPNQVQFGNDVGLTTAALTFSREIPMDGNSVYFTGQTGIGADAVGVGYAGGTPLPGKLAVLENGIGDNSYAGWFEASGASLVTVGIRGEGIGGNGAIGGLFVGTDGSVVTQGVNCTATSPGGMENYGVYGLADGAMTNYGIFGVAAIAPGSWAGWFQGDVKITSTLDVNGTIYTSDQIFKTDIDTIDNATQIINQLTPRTFFFDTLNTQGMNFSNQRQYGFVSQEVAPILPELVTQSLIPATLDSLGNVIDSAFNYQTLNYNAFIALLMKGMQEQQAVIENLSQQINDLNATVNNCCSQGNSLTAPNNNTNQHIYNVTNIDVKLGDNDCVLNVNSPNPFRDNTTISYLIPDNAKFAQIIFYNSLGQAIKIVDIDEKGQGRLNVYGEDLRSGMYSYSLIIDGNVCETHKMIKE
jgi:hypothetical protein